MTNRTKRFSLRAGLVAIALTVGSAGTASATPIWNTGDVLTYDMSGWAVGAGATLLETDFPSVYASTFGIVTVGFPPTGFSLSFDAAARILLYLPAGGAPNSLTSNYLDPTSTSSGEFGGNVLALQLDVDFSDHGFLVGTLGIPFGNLILENFTGPLGAFNGMTVRNFLGTANVVLGGGFTPFTPSELDPLAVDLTDAFAGGGGLPFGAPDTFAQDHLVAPTSGPSAVPEPATLTLTALGLAGVVSRSRRRRAAR